MKVSKLCFLFAMPDEAKPLIEHFGLMQIGNAFGALPPIAYKGHYNNIELFLVINGKDEKQGVDLVGTQPATLAAHLAIEKFKPDLVINAGTAGAFASNGSEIGDVYLSHQHIVFHDRRIPIPGWDEYGVGKYPTYDATLIARALEMKQGIITTGNSLDMSPEDEKMIADIGGEVKEMEAAAMAWAASLHKVPFFCIKSITDLMDSEKTTQEEFLENLQMASVALKDACFRVVEYIEKNEI